MLAAELRTADVPAVAVLGNHDHELGRAAEVTRVVTDAEWHGSTAMRSRSRAWALRA